MMCIRSSAACVPRIINLQENPLQIGNRCRFLTKLKMPFKHATCVYLEYGQYNYDGNLLLNFFIY